MGSISIIDCILIDILYYFEFMFEPLENMQQFESLNELLIEDDSIGLVNEEN